MEKMMSSKELFGYAAGICENPGELKSIMHSMMIWSEMDFVEGFNCRIKPVYNGILANDFHELFGLFGEAYLRACEIKYKAERYEDDDGWNDWEVDENGEPFYNGHYDLPSYNAVYEEFIVILNQKGFVKEASEMVDWTFRIYADNLKRNLGIISYEEPKYRELSTVIRRIESAVKTDIPSKEGDEKLGMISVCYLLLKTAAANREV